MKKPDEIKKGMECCDFDHWQGRKCEQCPYMNADDEWCKSMDEIRNDTLALIQQLEAQVPKWISVKERLPEGECLAGCFAHGSYGYGEYIIGYVAPYSESEGSGYYAENSFVLLDDVTHWMPLPEPPKEDDHAQTD